MTITASPSCEITPCCDDESARHDMADLALTEIVAARFKALGEPTRLQILMALGVGELTVTELVERTGLGQPNLSKHLQLLHGLGFVRRRKQGSFVYYGLADREVLRLCDLMCGRVEAETTSRRRLFPSG